MAPTIGIDLGTTYSCVATFFNGKINIIHNEQGNPTTPSYVAFKVDKRLIGEAAKDQVIMNACNTIYDSKRLIGRGYYDAKVQQDLATWSFKVICNGDGNPEIEVKSNDEMVHFPPEQISSMILENLKQLAEKYLRDKVTQAVITVPAYFNQRQREATKLAGEIAGLNVLEIINEPTAAALAYGLEQRKQGFQIVLIFDLGGGTFDVSIIKIVNGGTFEVKAVAGDDHLGGEDFDQILVEHFAQEFERKFDSDIRSNPRTMARLRKECERAKRTLSSTDEAAIEIECLYDGLDFSSSITRARFELLCQNLFESTIEPIERALADAEMDKDDIDEVVMVGGSTRIPKIQQMVSDFFERERINYTINPDEAVAKGAAIRAAILAGEDFGHVQNVKLIDVVPLSLGISVGCEGEMSTVVNRNTKVPCEVRKPFSTLYDNQIKVNIRVYEGERPMVDDNHFLGDFQLTGITPAPRGVTEVEVVFSVNTDGILTVSAQEIGRDNVKKELKIDKKNNRLTSADVQRMIDEAANYAKQDEAHKQRLFARNSLEDYVVQCQQAILNNGISKNLTDLDRKRIRDKCADEMHFLNEANIAKDVLDQRYKDFKQFIDGYDWKV